MKFVTNKNHKSAFTIIESLIAICLVVTVITGFYFAKRIIKENDVKSLIMQIKKYDAAINSFTQKYRALPGDVQGTVTYGITETNSDGNGDNIITDRAQNIIAANGEMANFWMHLSKSKMLNENYDGKENEKAKIGSTFPVSKIGEKVGIIVFGDGGETFYQIGLASFNRDRLYTKNNSLKTDEAFLFDRKIDDGNPKKGYVVAVGGDSLNILQNNECMKFNEYNLGSVSPACQVRIEMK